MRFKLEIECDNAAFEDEGIATEIARILSVARGRVREGETAIRLRDINGNTVGRAELAED